MSPWTDERVEQLRKLCAKGYSYGQIAKALGGGITRNAALGKAHRLGISGRAKPTRPAILKVRLPAPPRRAPPVRAPDVRPAVAAPLPVETVRAASPSALPNEGCKWPLGDPRDASFGYCGANTDGRYCSKHAALAYRPVKPKALSTATDRRGNGPGLRRPCSTVMDRCWS